MTNSVIGAVVLTAEEERILKETELQQEKLFGEDVPAERNGELVLALMRSLLGRKAIPDVRLRYFEDPAFRSGRRKGSYRALLERNGTTGDDIYRSLTFLKYLRYFLSGAALPNRVRETFVLKARSYGHVGPSDALELGDLARKLARDFGLSANTAAAAEEFYKLALDCGIYQGHAAVIRDRVKVMK